MAKNNNATVNTKRVLIDKANSRMVAAIAIAGFVVMFTLVASRALLDQRGYQARVIEKKEMAVAQLEENQAAVGDLKSSYQAFVGTPTNIIGGNPEALGDQDGNNAKIILDALPSEYDYPALISSIEKIIADQNYRLTSIGGKDDEVAQGGDDTKKEPIEMPFEMTAELGSYNDLRNLLFTLQRSIRPIEVNTIELSGGGNDGVGVTAKLEAVSYYQQGRGLDITKEVVR